jgi:type IV secretion system protein VirB1
MAGLIEHESGWHQYAIGDNTTRSSYFPTTYFDAVALAHKLRGEGHNLDAGLSQINTSNWARFGLDEYSVFDPCRNVRTGSQILAENYHDALGLYPSGDLALSHALSEYNSGTFSASMDYAALVIGNARDVRYLSTNPPAPESIATRQATARTRGLPLRRAVAADRIPPSTVLTWALPVRVGDPQ